MRLAEFFDKIVVKIGSIFVGAIAVAIIVFIEIFDECSINIVFFIRRRLRFFSFDFVYSVQIFNELTGTIKTVVKNQIF